jgi:6-phosphofructokinase 1
VERLGGVDEIVADQLQKVTGHESRSVILGHLLRGGSSTSLDRLLGLSFGAAAVKAIAEGQTGVMITLDPPDIRYVPLRSALERSKMAPPRSYGIMTARVLDISFGD